MKTRWTILGFKIGIFLTIAIAGFGQAVFHLWNWLMPNLFGFNPITFWQAMGLLGLSWILFGGWRGFGGRSLHGTQWRQHMMERWEEMTPEEREMFQAGMRHRCGQSEQRVSNEQG